MIHKRSTAMEQSVKYFTGGLQPVARRANLTLSSDVVQDTLTAAKAWQKQDKNSTNDPQKKYRLGTVSNNILLEDLNWVSRDANLTLSSNVDQDT